MTVLERVEAEIGHLASVAQRRALWEDEQIQINTWRQVAGWIREDMEAARTPTAPEAPAAPADEDKKVKDVFASYREKLKREGKMR